MPKSSWAPFLSASQADYCRPQRKPQSQVLSGAGNNTQSIKALRALRALRPLRTITRFESLRAIVVCFMEASQLFHDCCSAPEVWQRCTEMLIFGIDSSDTPATCMYVPELQLCSLDCMLHCLNQHSRHFPACYLETWHACAAHHVLEASEAVTVACRQFHYWSLWSACSCFSCSFLALRASCCSRAQPTTSASTSSTAQQTPRPQTTTLTSGAVEGHAHAQPTTPARQAVLDTCPAATGTVSAMPDSSPAAPLSSPSDPHSNPYNVSFLLPVGLRWHLTEAQRVR